MQSCNLADIGRVAFYITMVHFGTFHGTGRFWETEVEKVTNFIHFRTFLWKILATFPRGRDGYCIHVSSIYLPVYPSRCLIKHIKVKAYAMLATLVYMYCTALPSPGCLLVGSLPSDIE